mmetsp:Transcript_78705/g.163698  ORF Transcript_78705/g.163698 Transcript_78705/m.163698 type:complete len:168 (-) Transcript_78705:269-772(-)
MGGQNPHPGGLEQKWIKKVRIPKNVRMELRSSAPCHACKSQKKTNLTKEIGLLAGTATQANSNIAPDSMKASAKDMCLWRSDGSNLSQLLNSGVQASSKQLVHFGSSPHWPKQQAAAHWVCPHCKKSPMQRPQPSETSNFLVMQTPAAGWKPPVSMAQVEIAPWNLD